MDKLYLAYESTVMIVLTSSLAELLTLMALRTSHLNNDIFVFEELKRGLLYLFWDTYTF